MGKYANTTEVGADRSRNEIERTLQRYGARQFMYGWDENRAVLGFVVGNRQGRFVLPLPADAYEQAVRQRWRALALVIHAKLEAVDTRIVDFDSEFLAHLVLPSGETVGDAVGPGLAEAYRTGKTPALLPSYDVAAITQ